MKIAYIYRDVFNGTANAWCADLADPAGGLDWVKWMYKFKTQQTLVEHIKAMTEPVQIIRAPWLDLT